MPDDPTSDPTTPSTGMTEPRVIGTKNGSPYVLGRPPVNGTDEELDAWIDGFLDAVLGPVDPDDDEPDPYPSSAEPGATG